MTTSLIRRAGRAAAALAAVGSLALAGCTTNSEGGAPQASGGGDKVEVAKDDALAAKLPQAIRDRGTILDGVNPPYAPNEFKDPSGKIIGFDIDLLDAVGKVLGVTIDYKEADFDKIIPSVQAGTLDMGSSSFTVNEERLKTVDFVTYFKAGSQWAAAAGKTVDPENACGLKVGVQRTTTQDQDEIPARSAKCTQAGKPEIQKVAFDDQDQVANAVALGKVDAMTADSPITSYAVKQSAGKLQAVGPLFDAAPYGWPVKKGSPLAEPLKGAMNKLIADGTYRKIAEKWGVESGLVTTATINDLKG